MICRVFSFHNFHIGAVAARVLRTGRIKPGTRGVVGELCKIRALVQDLTGTSVRPASSSMPSKNETVLLRFAKLTDKATTPTRGSALAAGYDLYSAYDYTLPAGGKVVALTDIQIALPEGCYGRVAPRSGLAAKNFIDVGAGVIDQDYRGNVGVVMFNFGKEDFKVSKGDRIAQLILERIYIPELLEVQSLDDTERGSGGFGSTGST